MKIIVTGAAGFIGFHLCKKLLNNGFDLIGIDNFNKYYDNKLKYDRYNELKKISKSKKSSFTIYKINIENFEDLTKIAYSFKPDCIIHLAAQAGVRYSITNPSAYIQSNLVGFGNILEISKDLKVKKLLYASSSSVYGGNKEIPFAESQNVDHPVSLYAASKKSNELMAHTYSHLFNLPSIGLRFFTVYGPWGRPDMALFKFTKAILSHKPIEVYNYGDMVRDFTYVDDVIESIFRLLQKDIKIDADFDFFKPNPASSWSPYMIFNIGNSKPTKLTEFISAIEQKLGIKAKKELLPIQQGDVAITSANTQKLQEWVDFKPNTTIEKGIDSFIEWYLDYYKISLN